MSRTFRRKNAEIAQGKSTINYSKKYGWYGVVVWVHGPRDCFRRSWDEPTKQDLFEKWYELHGDKHRFFDAPPPFYRRQQSRKEKLNHKKQFQRYLKNHDFEIISQIKLAFNTKGWY